MPDKISKTIKISLKYEADDKKDDDIWYVLIGDADWSSIAVIFLYVFALGFLLVVGIFSYAFFSSGMQWVFVLFILSVIAFISVMFMKRGKKHKKTYKKQEPPQVVFFGELSKLTETLERAKGGFAYSQQLVRERIAEAIVDKARMGNNMDRDEIVIMLRERNTSFIGSEHLANFLMENKRELSKWDKMVKGKGRSKESGKKFMREIDIVMKETEAML